MDPKSLGNTFTTPFYEEAVGQKGRTRSIVSIMSSVLIGFVCFFKSDMGFYYLLTKRKINPKGKERERDEHPSKIKEFLP